MDLRLVPERRLIMTLALRQAVEILQMPQLELAQWIAAEVERNPILEMHTPSTSPRLLQEIASTPTLHEHLLRQIRENFSSPSERLIAEECIEHLDERGFLATPPETLSALFNRPIEPILATLQTFDPPGIFAQNLQEALLLQLRACGKSDTLSYQLVEQCFDDLLHGRYTAIKKKLGSSDLAPAMQLLSRLSLRPAHAFRQEPLRPAIPDLRIAKIEGGWTLELLEDELPKFHIQSDYLELEPETEEERELLRGFKVQAKWVFRSLHRRRKLLREIGRILLRKQASYLDQKGPLVSITVKDLADKLHIHESTLSRALSGKYVATPRGVLPLRALVTASPTTETARELLEKLVQEEDKRAPLTDDQLAKALKAKGYPVARRTISKYRSQLKIGSATQRKHIQR